MPAPLETPDALLASRLSTKQSVQEPVAGEVRSDQDVEELEPENAAAVVASCGSNISVIFPRPQRSNS
jgi:hypothetical protein